MKYVHHIAIWIMLCIGTVYAKDIRVRSMEALQKKLARSSYSLVLFYDDSREAKRDKSYKESVEIMEEMFRALSKDDYYKDAGLQFIRAEVDRDDLKPAIMQYDLTQLPAYVIFLGREKQSVAYGNLYRQDIETFIDLNLKHKMQEAIKQADELRKKRLEEAKIKAYNRPYWYGPYWGGGRLYPYWWYGRGTPYGWYW